MPLLSVAALQFLDPRGRCNRKGLLLAAAILLASQVVIALGLWEAGIDLSSPIAMLCNAVFCWVGFALISKRLHDLNHSAWWVPTAALLWLAAAVCLAVLIVLIGDPDILAPGTPSYWVAFASMLMPLLVVAAWLHAAIGDAGDNRFGPAPTAHGFSMPTEAATFWHRLAFSARAGTA
jgi:uncharacterized membrane protein YhaH (DUF805 family)